jgi:hypothetical protein
MRSYNRNYAAAILPSVLALAACSGVGSGVPNAPASVAGAATGIPAHPEASTAARGWMSSEAKKRGVKVYVADLVRNVVRIYGVGGGNEIGEITNGIDGPYGMWVSRNGSLYVRT